MGAIKDTLEYEVDTLLSEFRKVRFWIYFSTILAGTLFMISQVVLGVIALIVTIILLMKEDHLSGVVIAHKRKKYGIPNKTRIKELKSKIKSEVEK